MRASTAAFLAAALALARLALAEDFVRLDIRGTHPAAKRALQSREADVWSLSLANTDGAYLVSLAIGTPRQSLEALIDTGSSDLWVHAADDTYCQADASNCEVSGTFDGAASSTFNNSDGVMNIKYGDGTYAIGTYAADTLYLNGKEGGFVKHFVFGYATNSSSRLSVFGVGYESLETSYGLDEGTYPNLPARLSAAGAISTTSYSLWLNDKDARTGSILFGAIDKGKFQGELRVVDIQKAAAGHGQKFNVLLTNITVSGGGSGSQEIYGKKGSDAAVYYSNHKGMKILLDSGTTRAFLPLNLVVAFMNAFGLADVAQYKSGAFSFPCSAVDMSYVVSFTFQNAATIDIEMSDLIIETGGSKCILGLEVSDGEAIAGDIILRSAYVTYDLTHYKVGIAQTVFNSSKEDIESIPASGIPTGLVGTGDSDASPTSTATSSSFETTLAMSSSLETTLATSTNVETTLAMSSSLETTLATSTSAMPSPTVTSSSSKAAAPTAAANAKAMAAAAAAALGYFAM